LDGAEHQAGETAYSMTRKNTAIIRMKRIPEYVEPREQGQGR
jgi:hypothetical protein